VKTVIVSFVSATMLVSSATLADARQRDRDDSSPRRTCEQMQERLSRMTGGKRASNDAEKKAKIVKRMQKRHCL
jgi:hypothetical protein